MPDPAKSYSCRKYAAGICEMFYGIALILIFIGSGLSVYFESVVLRMGFSGYAAKAVFLLISLLLYSLFNLPFVFYSGYALEHKFHLSLQKAGDWWLDQVKSFALGYVAVLILVYGFYWILGRFSQWWIAVSVFWIFFVVILARLTPVVIVPLFFKYRKIEDISLRGRILDLAGKMKVGLLDVFEIDFSKKTMKANAALIGAGNAKRVILADTLKDKYSYDEIECILAHEFAHFRLRHIVKIITVNSLLTSGLLYLIFRTNSYFLHLFGIGSLASLAGIPVLFLYFSVFGFVMRPLEAYISRRFERQADMLALRTTGNKEAFVSVMEKLAAQNLSDKSPHPLVKFFFFDHPPISERIERARSF